MIDIDVIVVGAGIAGASIAAILSKTKRVTILDMESRPGYHTTGRSAALFTENYGTPTIKALTRASRDFFENPPTEFCEFPLLTPRGVIYLARSDQLDALRDFQAINPFVEPLSQRDLRSWIPLLKPDHIVAGLLEEGAADIDVNALHMGYLGQAKDNGAQILCNQVVVMLERKDGNWDIVTNHGQFKAPIIVNAAGAWADEIAEKAGVAPIGLQPMKRTAAVVKFNKPIPRDMCFLNDVDENWYCKPEGTSLFLSPEDEQPSPPCDAWADDMDVATVIDKLADVLDIEPVNVESSWAGLRSFAPDREFVVGYAQGAPGFFWLAGQGGYGIQTAPAVADIGASLVQNMHPPSFFSDKDLDLEKLQPSRFLI
jgi:D-arginine dehydrogenase